MATMILYVHVYDYLGELLHTEMTLIHELPHQFMIGRDSIFQQVTIPYQFAAVDAQHVNCIIRAENGRPEIYLRDCDSKYGSTIVVRRPDGSILTEIPLVSVRHSRFDPADQLVLAPQAPGPQSCVVMFDWE